MIKEKLLIKDIKIYKKWPVIILSVNVKNDLQLDYNYENLACAAVCKIRCWKINEVKCIWSFIGTLMAIEISLKPIKETFNAYLANSHWELSHIKLLAIWDMFKYNFLEMIHFQVWKFMTNIYRIKQHMWYFKIMSTFILFINLMYAI